MRTPDGIDVVYATKARSLVDAVDDWSRFDSLPKAFGWIRREVERRDDIAAQLVDMTIQFGNQGAVRRIGADTRTTGRPGAAPPAVGEASSSFLQPHTMESESAETRNGKHTLGSRHKR